ncbi:MAG: 3'-5' exonuclease [Gammaproteobacteria bacterium]|jgi:predicted PolB exonuclease-like 3'-5' exonuclease
MTVFSFDIETVPDVEAGRRLFELGDLSDEDVGRVMFHRRRQQTGGSEFLPHHLHRVVAISIAMRGRDDFKVWTLGDETSDEPEIISRFFDGIEKFTPDLVTWNGGGFDLPVLHYRAMIHGISAPRYWETGGNDQSFKWNNYLARFHWRHLDLMDVLSGFQARATAKLDEVAVLNGLPGKLGMHGGKVWESVLAGRIGEVRDYCETDVLNTYLLYLRFERMRGNLGPEEFDRECRLVADALRQDGRPHLQAFLEGWRDAPPAREE